MGFLMGLLGKSATRDFHLVPLIHDPKSDRRLKAIHVSYGIIQCEVYWQTHPFALREDGISFHQKPERLQSSSCLWLSLTFTGSSLLLSQNLKTTEQLPTKEALQ